MSQNELYGNENSETVARSMRSPHALPLSPAKPNRSPLQTRQQSPRKYTIRRMVREPAMRGPNLDEIQNVARKMEEAELDEQEVNETGPVTPIAIEKSLYGLLRVKPRRLERPTTLVSTAVQVDTDLSEESESQNPYSEDRLEYARQMRGLRMKLHRAQCAADKERQQHEIDSAALNQKISELEEHSNDLMDTLHQVTTRSDEVEGTLTETKALMESQRGKLLGRIGALVEATSLAHDTVRSQGQELVKAREQLEIVNKERSQLLIALASSAAFVTIWTGFMFSRFQGGC